MKGGEWVRGGFGEIEQCAADAQRHLAVIDGVEAVEDARASSRNRKCRSCQFIAWTFW